MFVHLSLSHLHVHLQNEETRVYRVGVTLPEGEERENVVVPHTVQIILEAFNQLNVAIQALLVHAPPAINEVMSFLIQCLLVWICVCCFLDSCTFRNRVHIIIIAVKSLLLC